MRILVAIVALAVLVLGGVAWFVLGSSSRHALDELTDPGSEPVAEAARGDAALEDAPRVEQPATTDEARSSESRSSLVEAPAAAKPAIDASMPASPFEGRVVDERTSLPLGRFLVRLRDEAGRSVDVVTDDAGKFTSSPLAVGDVRATALDHEGRKRPPEPIVLHHLLADERPAVIEVASGPLYRVSISPARTPDDPESGPDPASIELKLQLEGDGDRTGTSMEPLRAEAPYRLDGEPFWVRFPAMEKRFDHAQTIQARTRDGLWMGDARASVAQGEAPAIVAIEMESRATLQGFVRCNGAPVADAVVNLRIERDSKGRSSQRSTRTGSDGHYRFEFQRAGAGVVRARSMRHAPAEADVTLVAGKDVAHDFVLDALPLAGGIGGIVLSKTGVYEQPISFTLTPSGERGREAPQLRARVAWEKQDGELRGRFEFGQLPEGHYRLQLEENDWFEWSPRSLVIDPPREDVIVRVQDDPHVVDLVFDVRDEDNGLRVDAFHLQLETYEGNRSSWSWSGATALEGYPDDKRLRWRLDAPGYPPQFGDLSSFTVPTLVDGRARRTCEISMSPGWGDQLRIVRRNTQQPVANAVVEIDGREAGKSGSNGIAYVKSRDKPQHVEVKLAGWTMVGNVDLQSPSKRGWNRFNTVQMQPAPKKKS